MVNQAFERMHNTLSHSVKTYVPGVTLAVPTTMRQRMEAEGMLCDPVGMEDFTRALEASIASAKCGPVKVPKSITGLIGKAVSTCYWMHC